MRGRRIVVTGATGFLGGRCVRALTDDYEVVAMGRNERALARLDRGGVIAERVELADRSAVDRLLSHAPDVIVHAAALSSPWGRREDFESANVVATNHVLEACRRSGSRLVHVSTPALFMNGTDRLMIDEDDPLPETFVNHYAASKARAERRVRESSIPTVILRPQAIIGAGDPSIAPRFLRIANRGVVPMIRGRDPLIDMTHVQNVARAIAASCAVLLRQDSWEGAETFNITNDDPRPMSNLLRSFLDAWERANGRSTIRVLELPRPLLGWVARAAEAIAGLNHREPALTRYTVELLATSRTLNIAKARRMLGYQPVHSIEDAFSEYFAAIDD